MPPKRPSSPPPPPNAAKGRPGEDRREMEDDEGMGEFEDRWEDELESDGEVVDAGDDDEMQFEDDIQPAQEDEDDEEESGPAAQVYIPHQHKLGEGEVLEPDQTVYEMLHRMNVQWPCLSFDILRDGLGDERKTFPAEMYVTSGTQAQGDANEVLVMHWASLYRTQNDDDLSDDEDDTSQPDDDAILEHRSIPHRGGVNRIRAQPVPPTLSPTSAASSPTTPYYVATWADTGKVHIFDIRPQLLSLANPGHVYDRVAASKPAFTISSHGREEGFALDWSLRAADLRLLSGDCAGKIHLSTIGANGLTPSAGAYTGHTSSVEDLQWSPSEETVFASASADQTVRVWDTRVRNRKSVLSIQAHDADVNVISWNRQTSYLLASGGDEGGIKVWDLRTFKPAPDAAPSPVAQFNWHTAPITSIEWHPSEASVLMASGADDQVTLWDLAVEVDEDEQGGAIDMAEGEVPPQLLFVHQGQKDIKEAHWHSQIPGCFVTTAADGFNVAKTISV